MDKIILRGIIGMIIFYIVNEFIMYPICQLIFLGDAISVSYHLFTYTGLILMFGLIIICTSIIVKKLDEIKDVINKDK